MTLWLGTPPPMAVLFCQIMLISACINMLECTLNIGIHATAQVRKMSVYTSVVYLGVLPIIYIAYHIGLPIETAYYLSIIVCITNFIIRGYVLKRQILSFGLDVFFLKVVIPVIQISIITTVPAYLIQDNLYNSFVRVLLVFISVAIVGSISTYFIALNQQQRVHILQIIKFRMRK